jgi:hypothetical protein
MSITFAVPLPTDEVLGLLGHAMERWHKPLHEAKVRVCVLWASNEDGPALKQGHYKVLARVKVLSLKERVRSRIEGDGFDVEFLIDEEAWRQDLEDNEQVALIDTCLTRLELVEKLIEGLMVLQRDDIGRPRLRIAKCDLYGGDGFSSVIIRHGDAAIEFGNAQRMHSLAQAAARESAKVPQ